MKVEFHVETANDLNAAVSYYDRLQSGLGGALRKEVYAAISLAVSEPQHYAVVERGIRRCFVKRFPYSILFRVVAPDLVRILVIRHQRRNPEFGLSRR